jgi:hypothetical protein
VITDESFAKIDMRTLYPREFRLATPIRLDLDEIPAIFPSFLPCPA